MYKGDRKIVDWFIAKNPFFGYHNTNIDMGGEYNGYIVLSRNNPFFYKDPEEIDIDVHGGFTYSKLGSSVDIEECPEEYKNDNYYILGWDTVHYGDTRAKWPKERVESHTSQVAFEFQLREMLKDRLK